MRRTLKKYASEVVGERYLPDRTGMVASPTMDKTLSSDRPRDRSYVALVSST
jgi:hypothetical protein